MTEKKHEGKKDTSVNTVVSIAGVIFGIMDEYFQSFISGRFSSGWDALSDSLGFSLAVLLVWLRTNDNKNIH